LKLVDVQRVVRITVVAPRRGAWIETPDYQRRYFEMFVAPRRGAWIETMEKAGN